MHWLLLAPALFYAWKFVEALFWHDVNSAKMDRATILLVSAAVTVLFVAWFLKVHVAKMLTFERWLIENQQRVLSEGADYKGLRVHAGTELTQFVLAASVILLSMKIPSRAYVVAQDRIRLVQVMYSLASLVCGWWGIPWGPVYTVQAVAKNLAGGHRLTVADLLATRRLETARRVWF